MPDITDAFTTAGPGLWEIGASTVHGAGQRALQDIASLTGIITVTLQISCLPLVRFRSPAGKPPKEVVPPPADPPAGGNIAPAGGDTTTSASGQELG